MSIPKALLLLFATLTLFACKTELYSGLSEREANEMMAILIDNGIDTSKEVAKDKTGSLLVDESEFAEAVQLLTRNGLPRANFGNIGDIFKKEGLISSPMEERARFIYALGQELSETISQIDGVLQARVHVVVPENFSPLERTVPSSASVFIRHQPGASISKLSTQIKLLVTNSIEGLVYDKVSVALFPADDAAFGGGDYSKSAAASSSSNGTGTGLRTDSGGTSTSTASSSPDDYTKVAGYFWVHKRSAGALLATLYALGGLAILCLLVLFFTLLGNNNGRPVTR